MVGCARYCSLSANNCEEISRRDDLESLIYLLIYLNLGSLPWQGLGKNQKIQTISLRYKAIAKVKMSVNFNELTKEWPQGIHEIIMYLREIDFEQTPDYNFVRAILKRMILAKGFTLESKFDWQE